MKKIFRFIGAAAAVLCLQHASAQNTSPYWSLAGNSNATTASKLGTTNGVSLRFYANNVQRMVIGYTNGNVGIGTTSLSHRLTVGGNGRFTTGLQVDNGGLTVSNTSGVVGLRAFSDTAVVATSTQGGIAVAGYNPGYGTGVRGTSQTGYGIEGESEGNAGVNGLSVQGVGVSGTSIGTYGVLGYSFESDGVRGVTNSNARSGVYGEGFNGVYGFSGKANGDALYGYATGTSGYGVFALSAKSHGVFGVTGTASAYAGFFNGHVYSTGSFVSSDRSLKQDIADMEGGMAIINSLKPKSYSFKQEGDYGLMNLPAGKHYGLIAQEVEDVLPQLVKATTFDAGRAMAKENQTPGAAAAKELSFKAVNYTGLIPVVVKGMQELSEKDKEIDALKEQLADQQQQLNELKALVAKLANGPAGAVTVTSAYLEQNTPNPVSGTTTIRYHLPETAAAAKLVLTNSKGQLVKTVSINGNGAGRVALNTSGLAAGTYTYSLWVDGKQTDSKRLVIAR